ncbi:MAG: hypothetical protein M1497_00535, partial [Nitrospirae bacterium]|nr:hypothetical protein [Nitrospirota bacterium]
MDVRRGPLFPAARERGFFLEGRAERDGMKIRVNGEEYGTEQETVEGLLGELRIEPGRVAVEV